MSVAQPEFVIARQSVVGMEGMWVKMFDPPTASPATPDRLLPTNPVPEVMAAAGLLNPPSIPHTQERDLLHGLKLRTWDNLKELVFFTIREGGNPLADGTYPAETIRMPRGVVFHAKLKGHGPPPHTIHWHGIEPTPINDGVGHCSMEIGDYTYQFQPNFIGSYFAHCHRNTPQHFEFGLFGLLLIEPPDAYFATQVNPAIPIGHCRDGKRRIAANLDNIRAPDGTLVPNPFPGFNNNPIDAPDPWTGDPRLKFLTDPHAQTVPYDVESLLVPDDRDSVWSDLAPNAFATFPVHGNRPGIDDKFHENAGGRGFFAFNQYNPDYFFVTGVPVPAPAGGTGTIPAGIVVPPGLNSGVAGSQVSIEAKVGDTILVRPLDAAYSEVDLTFPVDVVIIAWDGRALGVPPYGQYNHPYVVPANTPTRVGVARRCDVLIKATAPISSFATVRFIDQRGGRGPDTAQRVLFTARIPFNIRAAPAGAISGTLTNETGAPLAGVTVGMTGAAIKETVTDTAGNYSFTALATGNYVLTPAMAGFAFNPVSRAVTVAGAGVTGVNFARTAAAGAFSISGSLRNQRTGVGIPNVEVILDGPAFTTAITDSLGNFSFTGLANGRYTVEAFHPSFRFRPNRRRATVRGASVTALLFEGRPL
ncbi:MAG: carboxypeptidase regulatory-like domain-containing protein [Chloroflexi bacterium]|nr:carboxypeptidase regulatory-like domain-containing protein [Chloroflexota bacterium]